LSKQTKKDVLTTYYC